MGILHCKLKSFYGCELDDEEIGRQIPNPHGTFNLFQRFINGLIKRLLRMRKYSISKPKKGASPILPIVVKTTEPRTTRSTNNGSVLLEESLLTYLLADSSDSCASSSLYAPSPTYLQDEDVHEQVQCVHIDVDVDVVSLQTSFWLDGNSTTTIGHQADADRNLIEEIAKVQNEVKGKEHVVVDQVRWFKHYSSSHRILIVGDGDFSFSACLAVAFIQATNIVATSLNTREFLEKNYRKARLNIKKLKDRGCNVMHGIDATKMAKDPLLGQLKFDRVIFNFPFAGFFKELSRKSQLRRHRKLVSSFMKNAKEMINRDGEIHISHKTNGFHGEWNLKSIGSSQNLKLVEAIEFHQRDYPGYYTMCGFGGNNSFDCNPSKTYKFGLATSMKY